MIINALIYLVHYKVENIYIGTAYSDLFILSSNILHRYSLKTNKIQTMRSLNPRQTSEIKRFPTFTGARVYKT